MHMKQGIDAVGIKFALYLWNYCLNSWQLKICEVGS